MILIGYPRWQREVHARISWGIPNTDNPLAQVSLQYNQEKKVGLQDSSSNWARRAPKSPFSG